MKKFILPVITVILLLTLLAFLPAINRGVKISQYQTQLKNEQAQRAKCETIMSGSHQRADDIRAKMAKEMGLPMEQQSPQRTGTAVEQLSQSIIQ